MTGKITAFLSNSPTRALEDLLPFRGSEGGHSKAWAGVTQTESLWAEGQARASTGSSPWGSARHHPWVWKTPIAHPTGNCFNENKNAHEFFPLSHTICHRTSLNLISVSNQILGLELHFRETPKTDFNIFSDNQPQHWVRSSQS